MKQIEITVSDKVARLVDENTIIICDNSDYVANFNFDSEWDAYDVKTARFIWNGKYEEKVFTGTQCAIPVINDTSCVYIGVYAGNLSTTTGVRVPTQKSILGGSPVHSEPEPDVYNQIIALLESMEGVSEEEIAAAVEKYLTENPLDGVTSVNDKTGTVTLGAADVGAIPVPETATVGQTIVVTAIDESGKPTEWKAADMPDKLPNPYALTFTGAVTGSYDGSAPLSVEIPSGGGGSGGSGKAKSQILIDQEITELTASLSVTLEHDFHNLTAIIQCGSDGAALTAGSDGTAVASKIGLMIDTTSFNFNIRKVAYADTPTTTWQTRMIGAEWSDDLSVFKRGFKVDVATGASAKYYDFPFGGSSAMYGTLGTDDNAPRTGKTANIVVNGAYLNVGTRVVLWGEYYE